MTNFNKEPHEEPLISPDDNVHNTSLSSSSVTTGLSGYQWVRSENEDEMKSNGDRKTGGCVDQGVDKTGAPSPRALYTTGEDLSRTGYEPKSSSTRVVDGALNQGGAQ